MKAQNGRRWTTDQLKQIMKLWNENMSLSEIASFFNSTNSAINKIILRMRREGIPMPRRTPGHQFGRVNKLWTQSEVEYVIRRRNEKATAEIIAAELSRSYLGVQNLIQKLRKEDVPVQMLGQGCRRLWSPEILKVAIAGRGLVDKRNNEELN
jgi:biotin operon repressor